MFAIIYLVKSKKKQEVASWAITTLTGAPPPSPVGIDGLRAAAAWRRQRRLPAVAAADR